MNEEVVKAQCEQSFYQELYHYPSGKRSIVMDQVSERVWMEKSLSVYNLSVFRYLKEHPDRHIPEVHAFWEENGKLIVIEELISGYTLDYLLANNLLDTAKKKDVLIQICDGLMFLHGAEPQIIHRDLKPSNVMVTDDGVVKIIDYDAAKIIDETETKDTILIGTKGSAAPEQYGFGKCDERTDVYALGIMIREMFPDDPGMQKIADRATQLSPDQRYQNVNELRTKLTGHPDGPTSILLNGGRSRRGINIPGFRTRTPWKMVLASFCYLIMIWFFFTFDVTQAGQPVTGVPLWINRISILAICLCLIDLFTDWSGLWKKIPLLTSSNIILRILGYALSAFIIIFFWALVCVALVDIVS